MDRDLAHILLLGIGVIVLAFVVVAVLVWTGVISLDLGPLPSE